MKKIFLALAVFTLTTPALADSGDVPENFEDAILRESAADQGIEAPRAKHKKKKREDKDMADLPQGFEEAILAESAADQGVDLSKSTKKRAKAREKNKNAKAEDVKDMIEKVIKYNELYGEEDGPSNEEECVEATSSQVELSACLEMLGLRSSVLSSRQVPAKKAPGSHSGNANGKPSMDFNTD